MCHFSRKGWLYLISDLLLSPCAPWQSCFQWVMSSCLYHCHPLSLSLFPFLSAFHSRMAIYGHLQENYMGRLRTRKRSWAGWSDGTEKGKYWKWLDHTKWRRSLVQHIITCTMRTKAHPCYMRLYFLYLINLSPVCHTFWYFVSSIFYITSLLITVFMLFCRSLSLIFFISSTTFYHSINYTVHDLIFLSLF